MTTQKIKRARARAVLVGPVFKPIVDKLDATPTDEVAAMASTIVDVVDADEDRLIRIAEVLEMVGIGRASLYRKIAAGTFPRGVSLGGTGRRPAVGWHLHEVRRWLRIRTKVK